MQKLFSEKTKIQQGIYNYLNDIKSVISCINLTQIERVVEQIIDAYHNERFIYVFGNGGSASTASHLVADFNKGISCNLEKKFRVLCLNDNVPIMLAISNDNNYCSVFNYGRKIPLDLFTLTREPSIRSV